jgi:hypothetical protein
MDKVILEYIVGCSIPLIAIALLLIFDTIIKIITDWDE